MIYSWTFLDKKDRGKFWYIIALSIVIGIVIWGFLTGQYGMSLIALLISGIGLFVENNSKEEISVEIAELGIKVDDTFYDYSKIGSYTLIYEGERAVLLRLRVNKKGIKMIDVNIDNTVAGELKNILPQYIEENGKEDLSFSDKLIRFLKL